MAQQMAAQRRTMIPALVVGLGGTGYRVLKYIKENFFKSDSFGHQIPSTVRLISIDTDPNEEVVPGAVKLEAREKVYVTVKTGELLTNLEQYPEIKKWFPAHRVKFTVQSGARQIRALGRLALFKNIDTIVSVIQDAILEITQKKLLNVADGIARTPDDVPVNVFVVSSVSGGTGSGMLVDIGFIIREVCSRLGKKQPEMQAYFFQPDAFIQVPRNQMDRLTANGAAALKELDFFMENMEKFNVVYREGDFFISDSVSLMKPYDFAYLVSAVDISEQATLEKITCEGIYHSMATELARDNKSYLANVPTQAFKPIIGGEFAGKYTNYSSLGVSSLVFPYERVLEMCANQFGMEIIDEILEMKKDKSDPKPWEKTLNDFLTEQHLYDENKDLKILDQFSTLSQARKLTFSQYGDAGVNELGDVVYSDFKRAEKSWKDLIKLMQKNKDQIDLVFCKNLTDTLGVMMADADQGVRFARKFLGRLSGQIEELKRRMQNEKKIHENKEKVCSDRASVANANMKKECKKFFLFRRKSTVMEFLQEYIECVNAAGIHEIEAQRRIMTLKFLIKASKQIRHNEKDLRDFEDYLVLQGEKYSKGGIPIHFAGDLFEEGESDWLLNDSVVNVEDMRRLYSQAVGEIQKYESIIVGADNLNMHEKWAFYNDNRPIFEDAILKFGRRLFTEKLQGVTLENFLEEKGRVTGQDELKLGGENLALESKPMWNLNQNLYTGSVVFINLVGVEHKEKTHILDHVEGILQGDSKPQLVTTGDPHRVTLVTSGHGAPLFAVRGISAWEREYDRLRKIEFLHAVTEQEFGIQWDDYPFRPIRIEMAEGIKYFSLGSALNFIQQVKVKDKVHYYCTVDNTAPVVPESKQDTYLGKNRMQAFEHFMKTQSVRKLKHAIEKALEDKGSYGEQMDFIESVHVQLSAYFEQITNEQYRRFLEVELKALADVKKAIAELKEKDDIEKSMM